MHRFFEIVIRLRWVVILVTIGLTAIAIFALQSLRFEGDLEAVFPDGDPIFTYNETVEERFGISDLILLGVINDNPDENGVFNPRTLAIVKELSERIALLPGIKAVRDEDVASVATMDNITGTVDGMNVDPFMESVPGTRDALLNLKEALFANQMFVNWVVSQDGTGLAIMAKMEPSDGTVEGSARRMAVYTTMRDMVEAKKATGTPEQFHIAGRGALEVTFEEEGARDMEQFLPLVLAVIVITLYCTYRSLRGILLPLTVVVGSVIWTFALMAVLGVPIFFITSMMPVILMAIGVADGIHILSRYYDEVLQHPDASASEVILETMTEMWKPVILTSLTTAAGFLSFLTVAIVPIWQMGVFSAVGVLAAMVLSLTFFPAVLSLLPTKVSRGLRRQIEQSADITATGWAATLLARIGRGVARRPLAVWVPAAAIMATSLYGAQHLFVDSTMVGMLDPQNALRVGDSVLREKFQGTVPVYVAIEGHAPDRLKDPILLEQLDRLQALVEQDPNVGGSLSVAEYVKRMNRVMNEDRPEMEIVPTSRDLVAQYLLLYSFSGDSDDFEEIVDYDYQHANVAIYLRSDSTRDVERVVGKVRDFAMREFGRSGDTQNTDPITVRFGRWLAGIDPTVAGWETKSGFRIGIAGNGYVLNRLSELTVSGQLTSLVTSLGAVFLLTSLMFRSFVAGLINIVPISLVMVFAFGLLGLLNIPLEIGKSLTASIVIGIGIDYTIHFLNKYQVKVRDGLTDPAQIMAVTMATSGKAIFFNAIVVIAGFMVLLTSNFRINFFLGAMLSLNMAACLVVSMTVLPTLLNRFRPRFVYQKPS